MKKIILILLGSMIISGCTKMRVDFMQYPSHTEKILYIYHAGEYFEIHRSQIKR